MPLKEWLKHSPLLAWKYRRVDRRSGPVIQHERGTLQPGDAAATFVIICGAHFNQSIPNAATTCRMGWCHGFEQLGIPYLLLSVFDLARRLPELRNPICWIAGSDYIYLDAKNFAALKKEVHVVLVSTYFSGEDRFYQSQGFPNMSWPGALRRRILRSEPRLLFTFSSESRFQYYDGWIRDGAHLVSLPLACDTSRYAGAETLAKFSGVEIAFVGGYWAYKAKQFDEYLKPFATRLRVFGYSAWPYGNYGGQLPECEEGSLYRQAQVAPVINEPHVAALGIDINERVFKVLGAGGLAITDATQGYRDWFSEEELIVPASISEYCEIVNEMLASPARYVSQRERGQRAVIDRHTYAHRAKTLCKLLHVPAPTLPSK